ncbi:unnamed protein product [Lathyrus oleraceus]
MSSFATLLSLLTIALLSSSCSSQFILPIGKDPITSLFYTSIGIGTPRHNFDVLIDLGESMLWYECNNNYTSSTFNPLPCQSKLCPWKNQCTECNAPLRSPGCSNNTCDTPISNPFGGLLFSGETGDDVLFISDSKVSGLFSGCTDSDYYHLDFPISKAFPKARGILGLGRTQFALPTQLSLSSHKLPHKFALCLPSSNKKGLGSLFIGGIPQQNSLSKFHLTTIPLVVNPFSTAPTYDLGEPSYEYFIDVKSIKVGGQALNFKTSVLSIDKKGNGGTKIRNLHSHTLLHSSIYKPLVRDFVNKAGDKNIKKVASVAPFGACFDLTTIGRTVTGLDVPTIDLVLEGGVEWTIYGGNSMVLVNKNVACLGFVDGGKEPRTAVVIGGHILEDNLLEFDLVSSTLGFSSSLLVHNARCSNSDAKGNLISDE